MPPKRHRLPQTFPHKIVFIISIVLCMCACGSIVNAVVAWSSYVWGYYLGTGFWSGAVILLAGMFGIVASCVRGICAVKTFMIISIFGCIASLGMIALASGGLDSESGFYDGYNQTTFMTHVTHSVYLGLGILQLSLGVLSNGICFYYLFIGRNAEIYCVKGDDRKKHKKKRGNIRREGKDRSSTGSQVPLVGESKQSKRKSIDKDTSDNQRRSVSIDENTDAHAFFPIPYTAKGTLDRPALLRQEALMSQVSPVRNPYTRSSSFSTFGRTGGPDRESLIVHPTDDNASVADTVTTNVPQSPDDECHYAQTVLFGPPVPIEEDEVLPPYEIVDSSLSRNKPKRRGLKRPKSEELQVLSRQSRSRNSAPEREKRNSNKRVRSSQVRSKIPPGKTDFLSEHGSLKKRSSKHSNDVVDGSGALRLSRSADLLSFDEPNDRKSFKGNSGSQEHGIVSRDFAHSSDMILVMEQSVRLRHKRPQSQTMKVNRDKRIDRRRKALSAEYKLHKDQLLPCERIGLEHRSDSIDGSNPSIFAGNRIMPTKFSLRRPVRQIGMPHVSSPVPVEPLVNVPKVGPPPKPPRNYSVKAEDLKELETEVDNILADIDGLNDAESNEDVFAVEQTSVSTSVQMERPLLDIEQKPCKVAVIQASQAQKQEQINKNDGNAAINTFSIPLSPEVKLDASPVLKFVSPKREIKPLVDDKDGIDNKDIIKSDIISVDKNKSVDPERQSTDTMVLPSSPVMRPPPVAFLKAKTFDNGVKTNGVKELSRHNGLKSQPKLNFGKTNHKDTEIVYAKVLKQSPKSPVSAKESPKSPVSAKESPKSPVSPTSPTSPSAKVQKAKRLTYTFKDRDVIVFDPIGNGKEIEETLEATESISLQYPVEKPKDSVNMCQPVSEKNDGKIESRPNVMFRQPPLSPSERILQRKGSKINGQTDLSPSKENRPVILQPTSNANKNINGARPKTSNKGLFSPLVPPTQSHESKHDVKEADKPVSNTISRGSNRNSESKLKNFIPQQQSQITTKNISAPPIFPKPTRTSIKTTANNKITNSVHNNNSSVQCVPVVIPTTAGATPTSGTATRDVPVNRVQAISVSQPMSSNSQGVLRLPQSQYSRQVSDTIPSPVVVANNHQLAGAAQNINIAQQNNVPQNNDTQPNRPLFSNVL